MRLTRRLRKRGNPTDPGIGKSISEDGRSSFLGMVAGMTTTLIGVLWIFSLVLNIEPVQKKPIARRVAAPAVKPKQFDRFVATASDEELLARLALLASPETKRSLKQVPELLFNIDQRIEIANQIAQSDTSANNRHIAILQLLKAHQTRYGLHFIGKLDSNSPGNDFRECFERYLNSTDPKIYLEAQLCEMTYVLFEVIQGRKETSDFAAKLEAVLEKFPNNEKVRGSIHKQFEACIENDVQIAKQLAVELIRKMPAPNHPTARVYQYLLDRYYLIEANYKELFASRWANGSTGRRELERQSMELLERDDCGETVITEVNQVAGWFESQNYIEAANHIYESMVSIADQRDDAIISKELQTLGTSGLARTRQIGQALSLEGTDQTGKLRTDEEFENRIVMVLFFTPRDSNDSRIYFSKFLKASQEYAKHSAPVKSIAVATNPLSSRDVEEFIEIDSNIIIYACSDGKIPALLERFPVTNTPYLMLVDHNGKVSKVNVDSDRFLQEVDILIDRR